MREDRLDDLQEPPAICSTCGADLSVGPHEADCGDPMEAVYQQAMRQITQGVRDYASDLVDRLRSTERRQEALRETEAFARWCVELGAKQSVYVMERLRRRALKHAAQHGAEQEQERVHAEHQ